MRLFRRSSRPPVPVPVTPEFGVRLTLRKGDRVVRRDTRGAIHIMRVTEERLELTDVQQALTPRSRDRRRAHEAS
jgi:hypothetical protein